MITQKDVQYIAHLSRVHLTDDQAAHFTKDLENILGYINKLNLLDVSNVEATSHVFPLRNVYRQDKPQTSLTQKEATQIAVHHKDGSFIVPKVIE